MEQMGFRTNTEREEEAKALRSEALAQAIATYSDEHLLPSPGEVLARAGQYLNFLTGIERENVWASCCEDVGKNKFRQPADWIHAENCLNKSS